MKKLPKIYQNNIIKKINNNKQKCYVSLGENNLTVQDVNVNTTIEDIFSGIGYSYNIPIIIETKNRTYSTSLIAKTSKNLITIDNDIIPIAEIISITKKKN